MTEQTRASEPTGTALAKVDPEERMLSALSDQAKSEIAAQRLVAKTAREIANLSWGQNIGQRAALAIAEWGERRGVDVLTEIDILGGRIYRNANYWKRRFAELIARGEIDYATSEFIHHDARLDELAKAADVQADQLAEFAAGLDDEDEKRGVLVEVAELRREARQHRAEQRRRAALRTRFGVPDAATGACVWRVKPIRLGSEVVGVNWCGGGTGNHKSRGKGDHVGDVEPTKTAESRALRRVIMLVASHVPALQHAVEEERADEVEVTTLVEADQRALAAPSALKRGHVLDRDDYGESRRTARPAVERDASGIAVEVVDMRDKPVRSTMFRDEPDAYGLADDPTDGTVVADAAPDSDDPAQLSALDDEGEPRAA